MSVVNETIENLEFIAEAIEQYELALKKAFPKGASGEVFEHWNKARMYLNNNTKAYAEIAKAKGE